MAPRTPPAASTDRPTRADALRNRAKVLAAAEVVFAEQGTSASTEEVARRAGVGAGTVFRHFPTKESLLEAVLVGLLRRLAEDADALAAADDAGTAFFAFFTQVVTQAVTENALSTALAESGMYAVAATEGTGRELKQALSTLLDRAQRAGAVRADVGLPEVMALLAGTSQAAGYLGADFDVRIRVLDIVFDGLRPHP
jgi:AcrR family transcriptional regulator